MSLYIVKSLNKLCNYLSIDLILKLQTASRKAENEVKAIFLFLRFSLFWRQTCPIESDSDFLLEIYFGMQIRNSLSFHVRSTPFTGFVWQGAQSLWRFTTCCYFSLANKHTFTYLMILWSRKSEQNWYQSIRGYLFILEILNRLFDV